MSDAMDADPQLARLEALVAELEREAERSARDLAASQDRRAEKARTGEMGEDWQRTQQRLDRGETTLPAVFSGEDDDPAARRLFEQSQQTISTWVRDEPPPASLVEELEAADAQLTAVQHRMVSRARAERLVGPDDGRG